MLISLLQVCQEWGINNGDTLRTLRVPDQALGRQGLHRYHGWPCPPSLQSGTLNVLQIPPGSTPLLDTLIIKISTWNFQGVFLWVKQDSPWYEGWHCPQRLRSGTLNILQVPKWRIPLSWHTSTNNINMKLSGYLPWGKTTSTKTSRMTLSSKSLIKKPQCPPGTPFFTPNSWHTFNKDINTKLSGYLP